MEFAVSDLRVCSGIKGSYRFLKKYSRKGRDDMSEKNLTQRKEGIQGERGRRR